MAYTTNQRSASNHSCRIMCSVVLFLTLFEQFLLLSVGVEKEWVRCEIDILLCFMVLVWALYLIGLLTVISKRCGGLCRHQAQCSIECTSQNRTQTIITPMMRHLLHLKERRHLVSTSQQLQERWCHFSRVCQWKKAVLLTVQSLLWAIMAQLPTDISQSHQHRQHLVLLVHKNSTQIHATACDHHSKNRIIWLLTVWHSSTKCVVLPPKLAKTLQYQKRKYLVHSSVSRWKMGSSTEHVCVVW